MSEQQKPGPEADQFAANYGEGAAMPDLLRIVRDMPRGVEMTGIEAGFICTVDAAVWGALKGMASPPEAAAAKLLIERTPALEAPPLPAVDLDEFYRQRRQRELKARLDELGQDEPVGVRGAATRVARRLSASGGLARGGWGASVRVNGCASKHPADSSIIVKFRRLWLVVARPNE